ncbi:hypothetical protein PVAP13_4KG168110 [Panicum virgatum]|uniref:Uncharacterized protein n=1 Tax=Panicum virgatum TaxID=38727 RepID=A0A8T0TRI1_PANVG|nr:hypothetical protein PVAP13_4KG168110 [Panicum virgatum]
MAGGALREPWNRRFLPPRAAGDASLMCGVARPQLPRPPTPCRVAGPAGFRWTPLHGALPLVLAFSFPSRRGSIGSGEWRTSSSSEEPIRVGRHRRCGDDERERRTLSVPRRAAAGTRRLYRGRSALSFAAVPCLRRVAVPAVFLRFGRNVFWPILLWGAGSMRPSMQPPSSEEPNFPPTVYTTLLLLLLRLACNRRHYSSHSRTTKHTVPWKPAWK